MGGEGVSRITVLGMGWDRMVSMCGKRLASYMGWRRVGVGGVAWIWRLMTLMVSLVVLSYFAVHGCTEFP